MYGISVIILTRPNQCSLFFFFFNDTPTPEIYPLPLHDAFPIWPLDSKCVAIEVVCAVVNRRPPWCPPVCRTGASDFASTSQGCTTATLRGVPSCNSSSVAWRSEEHTSELQSQSNLVCRLLLETK